MKVFNVNKENKIIKGKISLCNSKSICNRALLIRALLGKDFPIHGIASADDSQTLKRLLEEPPEEVYDVGPAATPFRFLTAYLALKDGTQIVTGSNGLKKRPMKVLVDALNTLGANIEYMEVEGHAPLKIHSPSKTFGQTSKVSMRGDVTSQFISAMLLIAPTLANGLTIHLEGSVVEKPYILMTLNVMKHFGVQHKWNENIITVHNQPYIATEFQVEADWSAASYYYAIAALSDECELQLDHLYQDSTQGDSVIKEIMIPFGVTSEFNAEGVCLRKIPSSVANFDYDFYECPDVVQTLSVVLAALGLKGFFRNIDVLKIKETDRIQALITEFQKVGVSFVESTNGCYIIEGKAHLLGEGVTFDTYGDHRMAMSFTPLSMLVGDIKINDPLVTSKSYPDFWKDIESLGFIVTCL